MKRVALLSLIVLLTGCSTPASTDSQSGERDPTASVWSIDLVRTLPGAQADYVRSIENNWAGGRRIARERGAVLSYRAFVATPDSTRGWDILLMTEYADSAAWMDREATFEAIFASPEYVRVEPARPSNEMREFAAGGVVLRAFVSEP